MGFWLQESDCCTLLALCCYFIGWDPNIWWKMHAVCYFQGPSCKLNLPRAKCKLLESTGILMKMIIRSALITEFYYPWFLKWHMAMHIPCHVLINMFFPPYFLIFPVPLSTSLPETTWAHAKGDWLLCVVIIKQKVKTRTACPLTPTLRCWVSLNKDYLLISLRCLGYVECSLRMRSRPRQ